MSTVDERPEVSDAITPPEAYAPAAAPDREAEHRAELARRRRLRVRLMLFAIPVAILALLLAAKLFTMVFVGQQTVQSYAAGDYEGSLNSAEQQKILNLVEQWKAPYNTGTSYLQLGLNDKARVELESALPLTSGADQCPVRSNLAIAIERLGDAAVAASDVEGGRALYNEALAVLAQAPAECPDSTSAKPMEETRVRLEQKLNPPQSGGSGEDDQQPPPEAGEDAIDQLEQNLDDNLQDRQDTIDEKHGQDQNDGYTDTPW